MARQEQQPLTPAQQILGAVTALMEGITEQSALRAQSSDFRRTSRTLMQDANDEIERLRALGRDMSAQQSQIFLKNGVNLEGSPLLFIQGEEDKLKAHIDALSRGAEAEALAYRDKARGARRGARAALVAGVVKAGVAAFGGGG